MDKRAQWLHEGWQLARTPPQSCAGADQLVGFPAQWRDAVVPGTVAASVHEDINAAGDYDADDWWYRTTFARPEAAPGARYFLRFEGLATIAQVFLNGTEILSSRNMFVGERVEVTSLLVDVNQLAIAFRSLNSVLQQRLARPRWKTALVAHQNLRWIRTTLLGRMPGWTLPIAPVGPWQPIALECVETVDVSAVELQAWGEGTTGRVRLRAEAAGVDRAQLRVGETTHELEIIDDVVRGEISIEDAPLWHPHTHGIPALHACRLELFAH